MARLVADENVDLRLVEAMRALGRDVLTAVDAARANQDIPDPDVLAHATLLDRAVLTNNRWDFHKLHVRFPRHAGIVTYTDDPDVPALSQRLHQRIVAVSSLTGQLLRITRRG